MFKFSRLCSACFQFSQISVVKHATLLAPVPFFLIPISILITSPLAIAVSKETAVSNINQNKTLSISDSPQNLNIKNAITITDTLNPISVNASRIKTTENLKQPNKNSSISITNEKEINETISRDLKQMLRFEPGINVSRTAVRPRSAAVSAGFGGGNSAIEMRGLTGDRVIVMVDDIPLPINYTFGVLSMGQGNFAQSAFIKNVIRLRGSSITPYGSDAMIGGLSLQTLEPADLLKRTKRKTYFSITPSYHSADKSFNTAIQIAAQGDRMSGLIIADFQHGHEMSTRGSQAGEGAARTQADPLQSKTRSILGKLNFHASNNHQFILTGEHQEQRSNGNILSAKGPTRTGYIVNNLTTNDELNINRISLNHRYQNSSSDNDENNGSFLPNQINNQLYFRNTKLKQQLDEFALPASRSRSRVGQYNDYSFGGSSRLISEIAHTIGSQLVAHQLSYGLSFDISRIYPSQINIHNKQATEQKTTPNARYLKYAAYLQDEINIAKFSITPGVRLDAYNAKPYRSPNYSGSMEKSGGYGISPRLTLAYQFHPLANVYIQYARGYRAPSPQELYFFYSAASAPGRGYVNKGNPALKPETSNSFETGIHGKIMRKNLLTTIPVFEYSAAFFAGRYDNFIENRMVGRSQGILQFQNINLHRVNLYGVEGKLSWQINNALKFNSAAAWTHGRGKDNINSPAMPIASVSPFMVVAGLRYSFANKWHIRSNVTYRAAKQRKDIPASITGQGEDFAPPSSTLFDVGAGYQINRFAMINIGIDNLFNQKYWQWSDIRGLNLDRSPIIDAYSASGRTFGASLKLEF